MERVDELEMLAQQEPAYSGWAKVAELVRDYRLARGVIDAVIWSNIEIGAHPKLREAIKAWQRRDKPDLAI